jgi:hypothetical protein
MMNNGYLLGWHEMAVSDFRSARFHQAGTAASRLPARRAINGRFGILLEG